MAHITNIFNRAREYTHKHVIEKELGNWRRVKRSTRKRYSQQQNTIDIIVMVLGKNYNIFSFCIADYFPSNTHNTARHPARLTTNGTLSLHRYTTSGTYTLQCTTAIFISTYILYAHISYIGIIYYRYTVFFIICHIINTIAVMID